MTKRIFALALTLFTLLSLCSFTYAAGIEDLPASTNLLSSVSIVKGYEDGSFKPEKPVSRAEMAKLLTVAKLGEEAANKLSVSDKPTFSDVADSYWAAKYIEYCANEGIISGRGNGVFDPDANVSFQEAAAMVLRTLGYGKNNELLGTNWKENLIYQIKNTKMLGALEVSSRPATRGDIFDVTYLALFEPTVKLAAAGRSEYLKVTDEKGREITLASKLGVEVVPAGVSMAVFNVKGVAVPGTYKLAKGETIPRPEIKPETAPEASELCVLLDAASGTILMLDGTSKTVPELAGTAPANQEGRFFLLNKTVLSETSAQKIGITDLVKGVKLLGNIAIDEETLFIVRTRDDTLDYTRKYTGYNNAPIIYDAEYAEITDSDGRQYVYISNGQNAPSYSSSGQIFIIDPANYARCIGERSNTQYYTVDGAYNNQVGTIKFTESLGRGFFNSGKMPGLYRGVSYQGMRVDKMNPGSPSNPIAAYFANGAYAASGRPLRGVYYQQGEFYIGTNSKFREETGLSVGISDVSSVVFKPESLNLMAFYFDIDSSGNTKMDIRPLSAVSDDDTAYVWGTVSSSGKLMNLYIVHSNYAKWNALWD